MNSDKERIVVTDSGSSAGWVVAVLLILGAAFLFYAYQNNFFGGSRDVNVTIQPSVGGAAPEAQKAPSN